MKKNKPWQCRRFKTATELMKTSKTLIVIINYKTTHLIPGLLQSIVEGLLQVSILILDNESSATSYKLLSEIDDDRIMILRSERNLGFTGGVNYAFRFSVRNNIDFDYLFLINPDAFCAENLIRRLITVIEKDESIAAVSPRILDGKGNIWYSGGTFDYAKGKVFQQLNREVNSDYEVDVFNGCTVLFSKDKFLQSGMFDEELFMYYEEAELSMRLRKLGYKIYYAPAEEVIHNVSFSTKDCSYIKTYFMTRNKFFVFNKTMTFFNKFGFIFHELAFHLKNFRFKNAFYHLLGVFHFLQGKSGRVILK